MKTSILHIELKKALAVLGYTITGWAGGLEKPDGDIGVSRTVVIHVAQGKDKIDWIKAAIEKLIARARREYPEYYESHYAKTP